MIYKLTSMEVLSVKKISKSIKNKQIINEISFDISEGEIVGLLGPNGAGKTTTFYSILGLIKIDSGEVFLQDKDITIIPPHKRAEVGMSYLPQEPSIFRNLSVKSNILGVAERNFLKVLGGDCDTAVGCLTTISKESLELRAQLFSDDRKSKLMY